MIMHWILAYFWVFDVSFMLALMLTPMFQRLSFQWGFVDQPDAERKIHTQPMALLGGLAVFAAFALNLIINYAVVMPLVFRLKPQFMNLGDLSIYRAGAISVGPKLLVLLLGGAGMIALGVRDDKNDLHARWKFLWQVLIALAVALAGMRIKLFLHSPVLSVLVTVIWIVTITNAMNFLDNMDGLCAGLGMVCSFLFAFIAALQDQYFVCVLALAMAGALLGFLPFNFKPASIFLGDSGSHFVGYMLGVLPVLGTFYRPDSPTLLPVLIPLLILAVPLFDMAMVTWIRIRTGQPIYKGDVNHISHRLVRLGLPQSWAVTLIYLITLTLGLGATILLWSDLRSALIVIVQAIGILAIVTLLEQLGGK